MFLATNMPGSALRQYALYQNYMKNMALVEAASLA
jgi:hypothetical protein